MRFFSLFSDQKGTDPKASVKEQNIRENEVYSSFLRSLLSRIKETRYYDIDRVIALSLEKRGQIKVSIKKASQVADAQTLFWNTSRDVLVSLCSWRSKQAPKDTWKAHNAALPTNFPKIAAGLKTKVQLITCSTASSFATKRRILITSYFRRDNDGLKSDRRHMTSLMTLVSPHQFEVTRRQS